MYKIHSVNFYLNRIYLLIKQRSLKVTVGSWCRILQQQQITNSRNQIKSKHKPCIFANTHTIKYFDIGMPLVAADQSKCF